MTLFIGLYITRTLVTTDVSLFSVYTIVTVGLAFGVMAREALRIATVPLIARLHAVSDPEQPPPDAHDPARGADILRLALLVALANMALALPVTVLGHMLDIPSMLASQFAAFIVLRAVSSSLFITVVPYVNIIAYARAFTLYNGILLAERLADLVAVLVIVRLVRDGRADSALIVGGLIHACLAAVIALTVRAVSRRIATRRALEPWSTANGSRIDLRSAARALAGPGLLVLNMAAYFRLSLPLANVFFGETVGAMMAVAIQVSGYLRQAVQGLVTGLDSLMSREAKELGGEANVRRLDTRVLDISLLLCAAFGVLAPLVPDLLDLIVGEAPIDRTRLQLLTLLLLVGVLARSLSEVWMQFLNGRGDTVHYSRKLLVVAVVYLTALALLSRSELPRPEILIGLLFAAASMISHLMIVPVCLSTSLPGCSTFPRLLPTAFAVLLLPVPWCLRFANIVGPYGQTMVASILATTILMIYMVKVRPGSVVEASGT